MDVHIFYFGLIARRFQSFSFVITEIKMQVPFRITIGNAEYMHRCRPHGTTPYFRNETKENGTKVKNK